MSHGLELIVPDWNAPPRVRAAFSSRIGGVSQPPYDSLNLGAGLGDVAEAVAENRRRLREALRLPSEPCWLDQVHGTAVLELTSSEAGEHPPKADASFSKMPGVVCAVRVADCMPVLFASNDGSAVAAAHAGWRGLAGGVLEATIEKLGLAPGCLSAWMGPSIGPENFEVGDDVRDAFLAVDSRAGAAFVRNARGRWNCDLYALARQRLSAAGVGAVYGGGWCTFADRQRFFSHRRDGRCGRMAALVWIESGSARTPSRPSKNA
jgi:YfiH family protein